MRFFRLLVLEDKAMQTYKITIKDLLDSRPAVAGDYAITLPAVHAVDFELGGQMVKGHGLVVVGEPAIRRDSPRARAMQHAAKATPAANCQFRTTMPQADLPSSYRRPSVS